MSRNSNPNRKKNFEYSVILCGMAKLRSLIINDLSESVR